MSSMAHNSPRQDGPPPQHDFRHAGNIHHPHRTPFTPSVPGLKTVSLQDDPSISSPQNNQFSSAGGPSSSPSASTAAAAAASAWQPDEFAHDPSYVAYREELRCLILNTAQTAPPSPSAAAAEDDVSLPNPFDSSRAGGAGHAAAPQGTESQARSASSLLTQGRRLEYLKNYIGQVAPWLDMFDSEHAFGMQLPLLAQTSPALLYAILALSARQLERKEAFASTAAAAAVPSSSSSASFPHHPHYHPHPPMARSGTGTANSRGSSHGQRPPPPQPRPATGFDSLELYQEAIRLLTPLLQARDRAVLPICVILCCLEMMSASAQDWRRHLEGCAALFDAFGVHGFSGGLPQAVFWCYARMDLCGALISDGTQSTMVPPAAWLPPGTDEDDPAACARSLFRGADRDQTSGPDMHANYAVYLCARACELVADRVRFVELSEANGCTAAAFAGRWARLWDDLQLWAEDRPPELLPVRTSESGAGHNHAGDGGSSSSSSSSPFPQILYVHWAAISSNQLYHAACTLLLSSRPVAPRTAADYLLLRPGRTTTTMTPSSSSSSSSPPPLSSPSFPPQPSSLSPPSGRTGSAVWHAKRICGISLTNPHQGCLNNAIQPLWLAGRLLSHESEHALLAELIRAIEATTGWGTCWRIADLEAVWGYSVRGGPPSRYYSYGRPGSGVDSVRA